MLPRRDDLVVSGTNVDHSLGYGMPGEGEEKCKVPKRDSSIIQEV